MSRRNRRSLPVVALAGALLSGCAASSWNQIGHDAGHTGHNPDERTLTSANVGTLDDVWSHDLLAQATEPMVRGGRVYVTTAGFDSSGAGTVHVRAVDAATGGTVWNESLANGCGSPTITDATLVGEELWTGYLLLRQDPRPCGSWANPVRLDPADGSLIEANGSNIGSSPAAELDDGADHATVQVRISLSPLVVQVLSLGDSPQTTWTGSVPGAVTGPPEVAPTARDGMVHVAYANSVHSYSLYGCGADPCNPVWSTDVQEPVTALVDGGTTGLVFAAAGDNLVSLDRTTGQPTIVPLAGTVSGMALVESTLYVAAGPSLYAYDISAGGSSSWIRPLSAPATASPVVAGGVVYVGESSGAVEAFDPSGNLLTAVTVAGEVDHVTVAAGKAFVVSRAAPTASRITAFAPGGQG